MAARRCPNRARRDKERLLGPSCLGSRQPDDRQHYMARYSLPLVEEGDIPDRCAAVKSQRPGEQGPGRHGLLEVHHQTQCFTMIPLTCSKLHHRQLRPPPINLDLPTRKSIPVAQRRPTVRRPANALTTPAAAHSSPRICQSTLRLDYRLPC
jgi:hypothetical protein